MIKAVFFDIDTTLQLIQMKALLLNPSFQCFHK